MEQTVCIVNLMDPLSSQQDPPVADVPSTAADGSGAGAAPRARDAHPGMPRWVKAAIAVVLVLIVALVIGKLAGVEHGPGMHGGDARTPASQVSEDRPAPRSDAEGPASPSGAEAHAPPPGVDHGQP